MTGYSWNDVKQGLGNRRVRTPLTDSREFATDFKARAAMMRQDVPERRSAAIPVLKWSAASLAAAAAVLVAVLVTRPATAEILTQVKALRVLAPHSGVMIMNDEAGQGTVVWITDMKTGDESAG